MVGAEGLPDPPMEVEQPEVPAQEFQPSVRGEILWNELDGEIPLDHPPQSRYSQAPYKGLLCERVARQRTL